MLMGEHAVLQGKRAISCAVNKRITVHMRIRKDDQIIINSQLGSYRSSLANLQPDARFSFVLACLEYLPSRLGFELDIESEFSHEVGLGSSAAVVVATLGCLLGPNKDLFNTALNIVRKVQGMASGADIAASVFGGTVLYRMEPQEILPLKKLAPLTLIYSGSKMATKEVIRRVLENKAEHPALFDAIFCAMDQCVNEAKESLLAEDLAALGRLFNIHHGLQEALGTCNLPLAEIVQSLCLLPTIYGAKISGSGLGDCAIGLGTATLHSKYQQIPIEMSQQGVMFL